jgi:hypothetical protein
MTMAAQPAPQQPQADAPRKSRIPLLLALIALLNGYYSSNVLITAGTIQ